MQTVTPLGARSLTDTGNVALTVSAAVTQMRRCRRRGRGRDRGRDRLEPDRRAAPAADRRAGHGAAGGRRFGRRGAGAVALALADADLRELARAAEQRPLALWRGGAVDLSRVTRLRRAVDAAAGPGGRAGRAAGRRRPPDRRRHERRRGPRAPRGRTPRRPGSGPSRRCAAPPLPAPPAVSASPAGWPRSTSSRPRAAGRAWRPSSTG